MSIGMRIKKIRKELGLTQAQLGERLGVSDVMIAKYETGKRKPKPETVAKFADALGVPATDLYTNELEFWRDIDKLVAREQAFVDYLSSLGYGVNKCMLTLEEMENPADYWLLTDEGTGEIRKMPISKLDKLRDSINSFAKYQINEMLKEIENE